MATTKTLIEQFANIRRVSTPLVEIRTTDPAAVASGITKAFADVPVIQWDAAAGFQARNKPAGTKAVAAIAKDEPQMLNPADAMFNLSKAPAETIVFVFNAHKIWSDLATLQAIWNLRDLYKSSQRTLVLLTTPEAKAPRELDSDIIVLDDPLPDSDQLAAIITLACKNSEPPLPVPDADTMRKACDALKGMSTFVAEQITALALTRKGVDVPQMWQRKIQAVEATDGATVYSGPTRFADIGGHAGLKVALGREITAKRPVKLVVIFDEFEKAMAGAAADHVGDGGVAKDKAQQILTYMTDHNVRGAILFGHPGAGKTLCAKAMANEAGCLCIMADMGAMSGGIVGESEARVRAFFALVTAIAGDGGAFFVATCNSTGALSTELRRRFKTGFYFVDLPTREEKDAIWSIQMGKFSLPKQKRPNDDHWTGAEIEVACEKADNYGISLIEAAKSIVPVAVAQPELIEARRREATSRLLSSATGETYHRPATVDGDDGSQVAGVVIPRSVALMGES